MAVKSGETLQTQETGENEGMHYKGTVRIETERLILRPFCENDIAPAFRNWTHDDAVTKYLRWQTHADIAVTDAIIREWIRQYDALDFYQWAIELKAIHEPIGTISVVDMDACTDTVHIGYCIGSSWWRQGITSEALAAVISFFFEEVQANRIESQHDPNNPNSGAVMRKCGLRFEGIHKAADYNNQGIVDAAMYALLRQDYLANKGQPIGNAVGTSSTDIWDTLYERAKAEYRPTAVTPFVYAHHVVCAIEAENGEIFTGFCMESCGGVLDLCAERVAALRMYMESGQTVVKRMIAFRSEAPNGGGSGMPCGACREFLMQLSQKNRFTEIMVDFAKRETVTLLALLPAWWGNERYENAEAEKEA